MTKSIPKEQPNYGHLFARYYDRLMGNVKYSAWKGLIKTVIRDHSVPKGLALDVACGTGRISELLSELRFSVVGIDLSPEMLSVARQRLPEATFLRCDVRNFDLPSDLKMRAVFAISLYDSLNYILSDDDMISALSAVHRNLPDGSVFLFDMNTRDHVAQAQRYSPRITEGDNFLSVFRFGGEGRLWQLDIDLFVQDEHGAYGRSHETHLERGYDEVDILPMLSDIGWNVLEVKREKKAYEGGVERLSRLYFIVRK